jgi:hypothetical protein
MDEAQHTLRETWDWGSGTFDHPDSRATTRVRLDRWTREDRPDIFTIRDGSAGRLSTTSRVVALAESFRISGIPMFAVEGDVMRRIPRQGHLPMHLADACRRSTLRASGPVLTEGGWSYAYSASHRLTSAVRRCLGHHFLVDPRPQVVASTTEPSRTASLVAQARRRGLPFRFPSDGGHV